MYFIIKSLIINTHSSSFSQFLKNMFLINNEIQKKYIDEKVKKHALYIYKYKLVK